MSNDTATYVSTARNFVVGNGFTAANGTFPVEFAPLYTVFIAGLFAIGFSEASALAVINVLSMFALVVLAGIWARRQCESWMRVHTVMAAIAFGYPLLYVSHWGWSEPLFICFAFAAWFYADSFLRNGSRNAFVLATLLAALMCMTRYAGAIILVLLAAMLFLRGRRMPSGLFALLSALPLLAWNVFNHLRNGSAAGERGAAQISLFESVQLGFEVVAKWFVAPVPTTIAFTIGLLVIAFFGVFALKRKMDAHQLSMVLLACGYGFGIVFIAGALTGISPPNDRLMAPLYPFAVVGLASIGNRKFQLGLAAWASIAVIVGIVFTIERSMI